MTIYPNSVDIDWYKQRLIGFVFIAMAAFSILFARLFYLQIIEGEELRRLSDNNCIRRQSIYAPRGLIFDRNGELLVDNRPSFDLSIVEKDTKDLEATIDTLANCINVPVEELSEKIQKKKNLSYKPVLLKKDIGRDLLAAVEVHKYDLPGVTVNVKPLRHYISEKSAAHVLGYMGEVNAKELGSNKYPGIRSGDYIGKFGVEKIYENYLRGISGGRQVEVDATGQVVRVIDTVDAIPGNNVFLTLDMNLQKKAESLLTDKVGAVVAMDPGSGEILALASSPTFDQNDFIVGLTPKQWKDLISNPHKPMSNKVTQGEYPPASTYKIITAMAGLEEGIIDISTEIYCPGFYKFGDRVFKCWKKHGHGNVDVYESISWSCDVFFYQVGQKLGIERLAWYANACGLGAPTGIKLDREANGLVPSVAWKKKRFGQPWHKGETLSVAIGQGYNLATPIQMLSLVAAVANDGERVRPRILKSIQTVTGEIVKKEKKEVIGHLPVSKENLEIIQKGLWDVVNTRRGTASIVKLEDVEICGKTGTAQIISRKTNEEGLKDDSPRHMQPHAWFVAYAPAADPQIAISIIVEHGEHGSSTAGPIARELVREYLGADIETAEVE